MIKMSKKVIGIFDRKGRAVEVKYKEAIRELKQLSDRNLEDIGISRCNIEYVVRHGLADNDPDYDQNSVA